MTILRVNKNKNYTTMSNYHFKEKEMSLKAKGLLSQMLSLPKDWDYSIAGLVKLNKDNETSVVSALKELKKFGYLKVVKLLPNETETGRIEYIYDIYENPQKQDPEILGVEIQGVEKLGLEILGLENQGQLNTNNKITKDKILNNKITNNKFIPPTLEEVQEYCKQRNNSVDPKKFYDYYSTGKWKDKEGKPVKNWKQKVITWEGRNTKKQEELPDWFDKDMNNEELTEDEQLELDSLLNQIESKISSIKS